MDPDNFIKAVDQDLLCPICFQVVLRPFSCREGHIFCESCILKALKERKECPIDRSLLEKEELTRVLSVEKLIGKMKMRCLNNDGNDTPQQQWIKKLKVCKKSGAKRLIWKKTKMTEKAQKRCDWSGTVNELQAHEESCPLKMIPCPYSVHGCLVDNMQRQYLDRHLRMSAVQHAAYAASHSSDVLKQIAKLQVETVELRRVVSDFQSTHSIMAPSVCWKIESSTLSCNKTKIFESKTFEIGHTSCSYELSLQLRQENGQISVGIMCDEASEYGHYPVSLVGSKITICGARDDVEDYVVELDEDFSCESGFTTEVEVMTMTKFANDFISLGSSTLRAAFCVEAKSIEI